MVQKCFIISAKDLTKLPYNHEILSNLGCLDPLSRGKSCVRKQFISLGRQFPNVLNKYQLGELDDELREYDTTVLPQTFSKFKSIETLNNDVDQYC